MENFIFLWSVNDQEVKIQLRFETILLVNLRKLWKMNLELSFNCCRLKAVKFNKYIPSG